MSKLDSDNALAPDGVPFPEGKYINGSYPGPRIGKDSLKKYYEIGGINEAS